MPPGEPPRIPIGLDAYRYIDRWPAIRIGARTTMRSTYDRTGGNEAADASHFLRELGPGDDLALDVKGTGVLHFARANRWHGSPWHYLVDGTDTVVGEAATATPDAPVIPDTFLPASAFPTPLALTWPITQGGDVSWVPVSFEQSLAIAFGRTHYGTGYFIYSTYDPGAAFSQPISTWDPSTPPAPDALALLASAGGDIAPTGTGVDDRSGTLDVPPATAATIVDLQGPAVVRLLRLTAPESAAEALGQARLRVTWDARALPSVDAPIPLFFGAGTLFNRGGVEYLVRSVPLGIHFTNGTIELSTYFPMPFQRSAHLELVGGASALSNLAWEVRTVPSTDPPNHMGYFHATYHDQGTPTPGDDLVLLDTTSDEGGGDVCGSFVGTSFIFSHAAVLTTLEGDPRFFFDGSGTPQGQGTGTEEWGAGGDYWNGGVVTTLPLAGHPVGAPSAAASMNADDRVESAYRFLLADLFPFGQSARIQLEHGGLDDSTEHYESVTYWYGLPSACLVQTDALHVGDPVDEAAHAYDSPDAVGVDTLTSRYELGVDHLNGDPTQAEVYPATTDSGRHTTGTTEFVLAIRPDNFGVLLRRKLDYGFADQAAEVFVADDTPGAALAPAGTWYLAGSNTCVYSFPAAETGVSPPALETSNRRWRDDEFLLPRALTQGRAAIRIRLVYAPPSAPIVAGAPPLPSAWSEYRYTAYSYVMPTAP